MNLLYFAVCLGMVALADSHGYLQDPLARTSRHLAPDEPYRPPYWYDNSGVWCDNVQQDQSFSSCGRCGEAAGNSDASQGGIYDKGVIEKTYTSGSIIEITADISAAHGGGFQVELCPQVTETDSCFQTLTIVSSNLPMWDNRVCVPNGSAVATARVQLPSGVRCSRCTLRWTYRTSYPPNPECHNPEPAQTFRNCADVAIV
ncbi:hypothetical protein Fcan01_24150 [Folsomia candida]|uniref:Chitin-binding type-4 domain-containing protein n=1 Tax=Folsomia candida TaxID=158441 RepID=A0A226D6V3_FOLCA|nr:hypothetical protein Fcan01_24150 [Folsomia candida]